MDLKDCLEYIDSHIGDDDRAWFRGLKNSSACHGNFGMWVRNSCGLWQPNGIDDIQKDIKNIRRSGIMLPYCDMLEAEAQKQKDSMVDYSLDHPDNISGVILEIYHDILNDRFMVDILKYHKILHLCPFKGGTYFGDEVEQWLFENMDDSEYTILRHPISEFLNLFSRPHNFAFSDDNAASAFKLRWL